MPMTNEQIEAGRGAQRGEKKADILVMRATTDLNGLSVCLNLVAYRRDHPGTVWNGNFHCRHRCRAALFLSLRL